MAPPDSVYDSSPQQSDLHFTFSTVQNGEPLSFNFQVFEVNLFDATTDLAGDSSDLAKLITTASTVVEEDWFTLDEDKQLVSVIIPWAAIEAWDPDFKGDVFAVLKSKPFDRAQANDGVYDDRRLSGDDLTKMQATKFAINSAVKTGIEEGKSRSRGDDAGIDCGGGAPPLYCMCHGGDVPHCHMDDHGMEFQYLGFVSIVPVSVTPPYITWEDAEWKGAGFGDNQCGGVLITHLDVAGLFECHRASYQTHPEEFVREEFPSFFVIVPYVIHTYLGTHDAPPSAQPKDNVSGSGPFVCHWHDTLVGERVPFARSAGTLLLRLQDPWHHGGTSPEYFRIQMAAFNTGTQFPASPRDHKFPAHYTTIDFGWPKNYIHYGHDNPPNTCTNSFHNGHCPLQCQLECDCGCSMLTISDIPADPPLSIPIPFTTSSKEFPCYDPPLDAEAETCNSPGGDVDHHLNWKGHQGLFKNKWINDQSPLDPVPNAPGEAEPFGLEYSNDALTLAPKFLNHTDSTLWKPYGARQNWFKGSEYFQCGIQYNSWVLYTHPKNDIIDWDGWPGNTDCGPDDGGIP